MFTIPESTARCQKSRCYPTVDLQMLLKKRLYYSYRCKDMVSLFGRNPTELRLIFTLDFIYQRHYHRLESQNLYFLQLPYLQRHVDAVAGKGTPLYNCFDFVDRTTDRFCKPVLNKRVVYSHHAKVHGVKFQSVVLLNGLIINLEGQWEERRHDCVLCFMNRVY